MRRNLVGLCFLVLISSCKQSVPFLTIPEQEASIPEQNLLPKVQIEDFVQAQTGRYDILWIVDNSGSMGDEQATLQDEFDRFITTLANRQYIDYQMGLVTTDMSIGRGALVRNKVIKATDTNRVADFNDLVDSIGVNGSGNEQGLAASLVQLTATPSILFRANTPLVLIYVSDENDSSPGGTETRISAWGLMERHSAFAHLN